MSPSNEHKFVFLDLKGKRWPRLRLALIVSLLVLFVALVLFIRSLLILPRLQRLDKVRDLSKNIRTMIEAEAHSYQPKPLPPWLTQELITERKPARRNPHTGEEPVRLGFTVKWDRNSFRSVVHNSDILTHLAPEWFNLGITAPVIEAHPDRRLLHFAEERQIALVPMLTNLRGDEWQPEAVESLVRSDAAAQARFFAKLARKLKHIGAKGVTVDFEQVDPVYRDKLTAFFGGLYRTLQQQGLELWLCIPVGNDLKVFDLDALAGTVDRFAAMIYDENGEEDEPGPVASLPWFREWLDVLIDHGSPAQWVVGIGAFGYDWPKEGNADAISFADIMSRANSAGEGSIENYPPYNSPHFAYSDSDREHSVWFLDAVTFHNQVRSAQEKGVGGIGIWRLGLEDPLIWQTLECGADCQADDFRKLHPNGVIGSVGEGDFLTAVDQRADGQREVTVDDAGVWHTKYVTYPKYPMLYHQGENLPNKVALTFDDGPDPEWTPRVLDILREKNVRAAFFVVGTNAASYPELLRQIVAEGHEVGNHTYSHANLAEISSARLHLELNATQRLVESISGRSTTLFRPPYNADRIPQTVEEFRSLAAAQDLGYIPVAESIDSEDWRRSPVESILRRVKERRSEGNVVLLHDAGGDRSLTVAALPKIIDYLRMRGDEIVSLHELLGVPQQSLMPPIPQDDTARSRLVAGTGFRLLNVTEELLWAFMIVSTALILIRTIIVLFLALQHKRRNRGKTAPTEISAPVSVIIAAYNEAKVIRATVSAVLNSDYAGSIELVVVDDGSKDATAQIVEKIAATDSRVLLIKQQNQGKAAALNAALAASSHEFVVMLDADTLFQHDTIAHLITTLADAQVGAVSGHAKVGNQRTLLGRFQSLEYTCGFNLDRRAYDLWNCITVVPGAVCAIKRSAILKAGGMPRETLAEDTDLTLSLHRHGYRVRYAPGAVAWTEVPESVRALTRQRTRWAFGTLQCLWKHRDLLFNPQFGALAFFSLPSIWFCHLFLVALIPLVDLMLIISLATSAGMAIVDYALIFLALDFATAAAACAMEGENLFTSLRILPMRFVYRPILSVAVWSAVLRALRGAWVGWGKQERKGIVPSASVGLKLTTIEQA